MKFIGSVFALVLVALAASFGGGAFAQQRDRSMADIAEFPLMGDDGQKVANHSVKLPGPIDRLPGVVVAANPKGKVTLIEFYDLNCPYCRIASADVADMVGVDADLRLVLVPFPVLGVASISASRVELALAQIGTPQQFFDFHHKVYSQRGTTDGQRALAIATELGLDPKRIAKIADSDAVTKMMVDHVKLGSALGLAATPAFIISGVAVLGYPGRFLLQSLVDAASTCGKVQC
ncbi:MAG TPA: DsbA family protein [Xanthobacteraceae bacterium]|jgi:protein-disulfide isomerase|nr:DsbA family protein [Xanthobacteraceae bacterium]